MRERGYNPSFRKAGIDHTFDEHPVCFKRVVNFRDDSEMGAHPDDERRKDSINEDRECIAFTPWIQGFTPKEHWEMIQEESRLKWQAEREEADRKYRAENDRAVREFQAEQARLAREHNEKSLGIATKSADNSMRSTQIAHRASMISAASVLVAVLGLVVNTAIGLLKSPPPLPPIVIQQQPTQPAAPQAVK